MSTLTKTELSDYRRLDRIVAKGCQTFIEVGTALAEIRDRSLWVAEHTSFVDYCQVYGMSKTHAYRLIDSAKTAISVSPIGENPPPNEAQARELTKAGESAPAVWKRANEVAEEEGRAVTAAVVRKVAAEIVVDDEEENEAYADDAEYEEEDEIEQWEENANYNDAELDPLLKALRSARAKLMPGKGVSPYIDMYRNHLRSNLNAVIKTCESMCSAGVCGECDGEGCGFCHNAGFVDHNVVEAKK